MTVALAESLTTYIPLWVNVPSFEEGWRIIAWQKKSTPNEIFCLVSGDEPTDGTRDYNDYDWDWNKLNN